MAAANIVTDVINVTVSQRPVRNVKPPPQLQELFSNTESEEEASNSTSEDSSEEETGNAKNVENMMVMLAIIFVALIAIDGSTKNAPRSQMKINILSVIYVNLRKEV